MQVSSCLRGACSCNMRMHSACKRDTWSFMALGLVIARLRCITAVSDDQCKRSVLTQKQQHAALGHAFHGEGRLKGFPLEDQYVFERFFSQNGSSRYQRNGTFVELGAHDGVAVSNTLWLERALGWSGVLIEASSGAFKSLARNRIAARNTLRNAVVCAQGQTVKYVEPTSVSDSTMAGIHASLPITNQHYRPVREGVMRELPCTPLSTILSEASVSHIDFFSLDVEGAELIVLQTIDFSVVTIGVILVELDGKMQTKDDAVRELLRANDFTYAGVTGSWCRAEAWVGRSHHARHGHGAAVGQRVPAAKGSNEQDRARLVSASAHVPPADDEIEPLRRSEARYKEVADQALAEARGLRKEGEKMQQQMMMLGGGLAVLAVVAAAAVAAAVVAHRSQRSSRPPLASICKGRWK